MRAPLLAGLLLAAAVSTAEAEDFSARLDALWDFGKPEVSEQRFRAELARHAPGSPEALEVRTQIARTQGLRRQFAAAHATLDALEGALPAAAPRVRVRALLERGRTFNSSGQPELAVPLFKEAAARSAAAGTPGDVFYTVDAYHMLGIAAPAPERLDWNLKALAAAEGASDARARGWRASLYHNLGWTYFDRGEVAVALDYWRRALAAREAAGDVERIRVARWTVARGLRAAGNLDAAERIQRDLVAETERAGAPDGYAYEELAEIALARGDRAAAQPWAAKAHAALKGDAHLAASARARLDRLAEIGGVAVAKP